MRVLNPRTKPKTFKKKVLSCELFVMDLLSAAMGGTLDEIETVIKIIKDHHSAPAPNAEIKEQTIILVSSVMSWINTPKKLLKNQPKDNHSEEKAREDESDGEDHSPNKVLYFTDKDFQ